MGLFAQKLLAQLVMPVGLVWLGLITGLFWSVRSGQSRRVRWSAAALLAVFTLAGNGFFGAALLGFLEADYPPVATEAACERPFDALFVAGGGTRDVGGHVELSDEGDRVLWALRLYRAGCAPLVITSGRSVLDGAPSTSAEQAEALLTELGVPKDAIVRLDAPKNSSQESAALKALIEARGLGRVGVISSAWHLRRIMKLAQASGLEVTPLPADHEGRLPRVFSPIPTPDGFAKVGRACWELLGALVGR